MNALEPLVGAIEAPATSRTFRLSTKATEQQAVLLHAKRMSELRRASATEEEEREAKELRRRQSVLPGIICA